jgi:hypothetical protein
VHTSIIAYISAYRSVPACGEPFGDDEMARAAQPLTDPVMALNAAALQQSELPAGAGVEASPATARDALRRAVAAHGRARGARRSGGGELWTALVAGRWSLLDSFTTAGIRYIVAHENPHGGETLRALSQREQSALEFALAGRSGKWIAFEVGRSESVVTRTLRAALLKLGVVDADTSSSATSSSV